MSVDVSLFLHNLEKKGFKTKHVKTAKEACDYLLSQIHEGASVGIGGSMTIREIGADKALAERGNQVYWHWNVAPAEAEATRNKANVADAYLCSTNAASMDGTFYNIDGTGNRVAAISYGKQPLFIVMSTSKIAETEEAAMKRIKEVACPLNAKRLKLNIPCAITGKCVDCYSPQRFCNVTCILQRPTGNREVHVVVVDEKLGF